MSRFYFYENLSYKYAVFSKKNPVLHAINVIFLLVSVVCLTVIILEYESLIYMVGYVFILSFMLFFKKCSNYKRQINLD